MIISLKDAALTPLLAAGQIPDLIRAARADSLVEYGRMTRVEPITMVDSSIMHADYMQDIMLSLNSIFTAYYLQAIMLSLNVGAVDTIKLLDRVNPNRDPIDAAGMFVDSMVAVESYKYSLPRPNQAIGLEAFLDSGGDDNDDRDDDSESSAIVRGRDSDLIMDTVRNLSVGKMIEIHVESEGHTAMIPATVRLIVSGIDPTTLVHILADGSKDKSVKERYHGWRAGQLRFWQDIILATDLIDEHRRTLMKDSSGVYAGTKSRTLRNKISAIFSLKPSVANASNLVVVSKDTIGALEREMGGRMSSFRVRQRVFDSTYVMLMVVVDPRWETVTIYHRGIETPTELSVKQMKSSNKGQGVDVTEILKAYQLGQAPTI